MPGKPNILIIWGDAIGWYNVSAYNHGSVQRDFSHTDMLPTLLAVEKARNTEKQMRVALQSAA